MLEWHWTSYCGSSEPKMASQQASSRYLKTTTKGELMTKGGNLFYGSTIHTDTSSFLTSQVKRTMTQLQVANTQVRTRRCSEE